MSTPPPDPEVVASVTVAPLFIVRLRQVAIVAAAIVQAFVVPDGKVTSVESKGIKLPDQLDAVAQFVLVPPTQVSVEVTPYSKQPMSMLPSREATKISSAGAPVEVPTFLQFEPVKIE